MIMIFNNNECDVHVDILIVFMYNMYNRLSGMARFFYHSCIVTVLFIFVCLSFNNVKYVKEVLFYEQSSLRLHNQPIIIVSLSECIEYFILLMVALRQ